MKNAFVGLIVLLAFIFSIAGATHAAPPDYKAMSLSSAFDELENATDYSKIGEIYEAVEGRKFETKSDIDMAHNALDSSNKDVQILGILLVEKTKDPRSIKKLLNIIKRINTSPLLFGMLVSHKDALRDIAAVNVLGRLKNQEAAAIIADKLGEIEEDTGTNVEDRLQNALAKEYGAASLPPIVNTLKRKKARGWGRRLLLYVICCNINDKAAVGELRKLHESDDIEVMAASAKALARMGEKVDVARIIAKIQSQESIFISLDERMGQYLAKGKEVPNNLENEKRYESEIRNFLNDALILSKSPEALQYFKAKVDNMINKRSAVGIHEDAGYLLRAMAAIGGPEVLPYFISIYERNAKSGLREDQRLRYMEGFLGVFGVPGFNDAIPFLTNIMNDANANRRVRAAAAMALRNITGKIEYTDTALKLEEGYR